MEEKGKNWFVVQTKPRQEDIALENLERQGFVSYLPKILLKKKLRNRWQKVIEPLFRNYLFIHTDPDHQSISVVRSTTGVTKLVRFGLELVPIPSDIIDLIKLREKQVSADFSETTCNFCKGDKLEITEGPLTGLSAIFEIQNAQERIFVLMEILGKQSRVSLSLSQVVKA